MSALGKTTADTLEARLAAAQHASRHEWDDLGEQARHSSVLRMLIRPWAIAQVLWYWHRFPRIAAKFADDHDIGARFLIFGHTHREGVWRAEDRIIINTGAFGFPGRPLGVVVTRDQLCVRRIRRDDDGLYAFDANPVEESGLCAANI